MRLSILIAALGLVMCALDGVAQESPSSWQEMQQRDKPPAPPIETALDKNGDGTIDANEIANAPASLRTLDKNGDGKLTSDECRPPRPPSRMERPSR